MKKLYYPAFADKEKDRDFGVRFHSCAGAGMSIEAAQIGSQEALAGHAGLMLADGDALPKTSGPEEVTAARKTSAVAVTLTPVVLPSRVDVTLDNVLLEETARSATTAPASSLKPSTAALE